MDYSQKALSEIHREFFVLKRNLQKYKDGIYKLPFDCLYDEIRDFCQTLFVFNVIDLISYDDYNKYFDELKKIENSISDDMSDYVDYLRKHYPIP